MAAKIDDKSTIPIFTVLSAIPFLVGGIMWLTTIDSKADRAKEASTDLLIEVRELRSSVQRIEIKLGTYPIQSKENKNGR